MPAPADITMPDDKTIANPSTTAKAASQTAAELLVKCLENEGVEFIFGIPGEENIDIMDALLSSPIKFVTCHHEQGAAFMADVYGRLTQRAGVCMSTLGPGATNLITGVADSPRRSCARPSRSRRPRSRAPPSSTSRRTSPR